MNWHNATVPADRVAEELAVIRRNGGTLVSSRREGDRVRLTWTTPTHQRRDADKAVERASRLLEGAESAGSQR